MEEEWKLIETTPYSVSNYGRIKNKEKILKGSTRSGYSTLTIKTKKEYIHKLVALYFIGDRPDGLLIDHIDRNKQNNRVDNLRYISVSDNNKNSLKCNLLLTETDPILRHRERSRLYEANNKEKVKEKRALWLEKNKEKQKEYHHTRYLQKKELKP
jgi:hypothetical protein